MKKKEKRKGQILLEVAAFHHQWDEVNLKKQSLSALRGRQGGRARGDESIMVISFMVTE